LVVVVAAEPEPVAPSPAFFLRLRLEGARRIRGLEPGDEREATRTRAIRIRRVPAHHPRPVQALVADVQRLARQAREDPGPHAHRTGGAVQAGGLVLVVADPHHREVIARVTGEPTVAAVVAGARLARGLQAAEAVADQLARGAGRDGVLHRRADQARGDRVAFL